MIVMIASKQIICKSGASYISNHEGFFTNDESPINDNSTFRKIINEEVFVYWDITLCSVASSYLELFPGTIYITQIISVEKYAFLA